MNRSSMRDTINRWLRPGGVRVVNTKWGPRGFAESFRKIRRQGVMPRSIVDVGASNGAWTRECMTIFPSAEYFLVDALEDNRGELEALAREHANTRHWIGALGSEPGCLRLHVHGDQSSFLSSEYDRPGAVREVEVRTLPMLLSSEHVTQPDLIKIDVQGYELAIVNGAHETLRATDFALLEVSFRQVYAGGPLAHEVIAAMGELGFRIYDICTYAQRPHDLELFQADILFAKANSKLFAFEGYA